MPNEVEELNVRHTRLHLVEITVCIASTVLLLLLSLARWPSTGLLSGLLLLVQPYALLRLLEHFRPVPSRARWTAIGFAAGGPLALLLLSNQRALLLAAAAVYFMAMQGYAAWASAEEAGRRVGITRARLWLVAAGATIAVLLVLLAGVNWIVGSRLPFVVHALLSLGLAAFYIVGLAPPRRLLRSWQQIELLRFLRITAARAPRAREDHLADDLNSAAMRGVTALTTAVLLGDEELSAGATSDPAWDALRVKADMGLLGVALGGTDPVVGTRKELERPLNELATGEVAAAVPIGRSSRRWGVLVITQPRASMFLPEDLALLGALCRHAADVLDHARLMHEERERLQRASYAPAYQA